MRTNLLLLLVVSSLMGRVASAQDVAVEAAQTAEGATLRGAGAYLKGLGWYNLNTAQANAINADTAIKWQRDLRKLAQDDRDLRARFAAGKTARLEDVKRRLRDREQQLRTNPSGNDVVSGEALNVLFFDLTDPDFTTDRWLKNPVKLPNGMSVKDLTFQFMSASNSSDSSKLLSKGVIALSRLDIEGKWTTALSVDALASERTSYEKAYAKVRDQVLAGKLTVDALLAMDRTLDSLKSKVQTAVPMERGFRTEATRCVDDLKTATRMFDASTVEYAKEMLLDTQEHDAKTVLELVRFMLKYRLQFATTERSPAGRELYGELYELMKQQLKNLAGGGIRLEPAPQNNTPPDGFIALFNGMNLNNWRETKPGHWTVRNGILHYDGKGESLVTSKNYGDFELFVDWKIALGGDSGIYLRGKPQVQIWDRPIGSGGLYNNKSNPSAPTHQADRAVGEWNTFFIRIIDDKVTVLLNGQKVVDHVTLENYPSYTGRIPNVGPIELQHHGSQLMFRNIYLRPLP